MLKCPHCGKLLDNSARFCDACGMSVYETVFCPHCGEKTTTVLDICPKCGATITEPKIIKVTTRSNINLDHKTAEPVASKSNSYQTGILIASIAIGALAIIAVIVAIMLGSKGKRTTVKQVNIDPFGLYIKDSELYYVDNNNEYNSIQITTNLLNNNESVLGEAKDYDNIAEDIGEFLAINYDGTRIFYPDLLELDETKKISKIALYYRDMNRSDIDATLVDSGVTSYAINDSGNEVVYLKDEELYLYSIGSKDKKIIATDVKAFKVTDNCKKIGYICNAGGYYLWSTNSGAQKTIDHIDVDNVEYISDDLSTVYYIINGTLYKKTGNSSDSLKIATDVTCVNQIYDSGEIYFARSDGKMLMDYVDDDLAEADVALTKPTYPSNPTWENILEYNRASAAYEDKQKRDILRSELKRKEATHYYSVYYYDGAEEIFITDRCVRELNETTENSQDAAIILEISDWEIDMESKIKMSEISETYDVMEFAWKKGNSRINDQMACVAFGANIYELYDDPYGTNFLDNGEALYYEDMTNATLDGSRILTIGNIYRVNIANGKLEEPVLVYKDVYFDYSGDYLSNTIDCLNENKFYIDGEFLDYDVRPNYRSFTHLNDGTILYYTDWNLDANCGTLKTSKDETSVTVANNVNNYIVVGKDDIMYLSDYNVNTMNGELYIYNNGEQTKIDTNVEALTLMLSDTSTIVRGDRYRW